MGMKSVRFQKGYSSEDVDAEGGSDVATRQIQYGYINRRSASIGDVPRNSLSPTSPLSRSPGAHVKDIESEKEEAINNNQRLKELRERIAGLKRWRKDLERSVMWQREEYWRVERAMGKAEDTREGDAKSDEEEEEEEGKGGDERSSGEIKTETAGERKGSNLGGEENEEEKAEEKGRPSREMETEVGEEKKGSETSEEGEGRLSEEVEAGKERKGSETSGEGTSSEEVEIGKFMVMGARRGKWEVGKGKGRAKWSSATSGGKLPTQREWEDLFRG
ncbi:MAG: hypothetical protein Q9190_003041 [Brigantiaea leucoxantha]